MRARRVAVGWLAGLIGCGLVTAGGMPVVSAAAAGTDRWQQPARVWTAPSHTTVSNLSQVVDSRGVVTAVWTVASAGSSRVMAARHGAGGWSKARAVITAAGTGGYVATSVVVGPTDDVVVAAAPEGSSGVRVSAARFSAGSWAPALTLAEYPDADSLATHVYGLSAVSDGSGASVLWQVRANDVSSTTFAVRGLPSGAATWTAPVVLDGQATGSFAAVRDGADSTRVVWQHGPDVMTAQGSALGWAAAQSIGPTGAVDGAHYAYASVSAAADLDGTVLVAWEQATDPAGVTCPSAFAALRTSAGWAPALPLPVKGNSPPCLAQVTPFVGAGVAPTVVGVEAGRWIDYSVATVWSGTAWGPPQQTEGWPYGAGSSVLAIDVKHEYAKPSGPDPDHQWLTSSTLAAGGWGPPQRATDPTGGWVEGFEGATAPDGSYVLVYAKRRPWRAAALWSARYAGGAWSKAELVARPARVGTRSAGVVPAVPVVAPNGQVTATWLRGNAVFASTTTGH